MYNTDRTCPLDFSYLKLECYCMHSSTTYSSCAGTILLLIGQRLGYRHVRWIYQHGRVMCVCVEFILLWRRDGIPVYVTIVELYPAEIGWVVSLVRALSLQYVLSCFSAILHDQKCDQKRLRGSQGKQAGGAMIQTHQSPARV